MTSVEVSGQEEVQMTSPVRPEELSAAIDSILLDTEQSVSETSDGQAQVCAPSPALVSHPPASPPVADNAPDLWLRLLRPLRLRSTRPLTLWPFPFLQRVPLTQGISFLVRRALMIRPPMLASLMRQRSAMREWASNAYSENFQPMNLFAIRKGES